MLAVALILLSLWKVVESNVIGLDFGSDSLKVALVQPGSPLEIGIVINLTLLIV